MPVQVHRNYRNCRVISAPRRVLCFSALPPPPHLNVILCTMLKRILKCNLIATKKLTNGRNLNFQILLKLDNISYMFMNATVFRFSIWDGISLFLASFKYLSHNSPIDLGTIEFSHVDEKNFTRTSPKHILAASVLWICSINIWIKNVPSLKVLFKWINGCIVCNWFHRPLHAIMLNLSCECRKIMPSPGSLTLLHPVLGWDTSLCPSCQRFPPLCWREKRPGLPLPMRLPWVHGLRSLSTH